MATIKASDLIKQVLIPLNEGWGYVWGTYGQLWTENSNITSRAPANSKEQYRLHGKKWIGHRVTDCSGLLYWAAKELGGYIYHGSNTIYKQCTRKGKLIGGIPTDGSPLQPGMAVFLYNGSTRHHVGLYIGGGTVVEAKGTRYGVVASEPRNWDEWGCIKDVEYDVTEDTQPSIPDGLRNGDKGNMVYLAQALLEVCGHTVQGIDGKFGSNTATAVKAFQKANSLSETGVLTKEDWAVLFDAAREKI